MRTLVPAVLLSMALLGCGGSASSPALSASPAASPSVSPAAGAAGVLAGVPTGCYGLGLDECQRVVGNVAAAAVLAWLGLTWSAELYEQTIKRLHRPGQRHHVTVHIPMVFGSVDELDEIPGFPQETLEELKQRATV